MSVIYILSEGVANRIAAGEVVERPASVVKELAENSIDAGAHKIEVDVEAGGKRLIRVADDGCGMSHDDALLAFERHATSKIRSSDDLFEISTLGFRGEALPSISSISRLVLETRHASSNSGTRVEWAGSKLVDVKEIAWSGGTRIEVRDLFYNTPARRKFLKSESTELGHTATLLTHYALAHPDKSFRLSSFTNEILNVAPVASHRERVYQVMGGQLLEQLIEMSPLERSMLPGLAPAQFGARPDESTAAEEAAIIKVSGFVSRPDVEKLNRNNIYFFVNRRLVRDRLILHAVSEAYRNILPAGVFPVVLIFLELPPAEVDVNVHPSKTEVRFRHSSFIHDFVRDSIRQVLISARPVAAFPLPKRVLAPDVNEAAEFRERLDEEAAGGQEKFEDSKFEIRKSDAGPGPRDQDPTFPRGARNWSQRPEFSLTAPTPPPRSGDLPLDWAGGSPNFALDVTSLSALVSRSEPQPVAMTSASTGLPVPAVLIAACDAAYAESVAASEGEKTRSAIDEFPQNLIPLGQVRDSFIVATNADGLWIIDQHVAHERVLFERQVKLSCQSAVEGQRLLLPRVVELKPEQQATLGEISSELEANGFEVEPFGQRTVAIKTTPADVAVDDADRLLLEILDGVGPQARAVSLNDLRARIAASVACHAAIKINMPLETSKMRWLLAELAKTECPMTCPHGRPIVLRYSLREIQKAFKRV